MDIEDNYSKILFSSLFNYQKEAVRGDTVFTITAGVNTTFTLAHGLGYVPTAKVWYEPRINNPEVASNQIWPLAGYQYGDLASISLNTLGYYYLDTANLYIVLFNSGIGTKSVRTYWRVYYDT